VSQEKIESFANEDSKTASPKIIPQKVALKVKENVCKKHTNTPKQSFSNFQYVFMDEKCTIPVIFHNSIDGELEERLLNDLREKMLACGKSCVDLKEEH
jgi:hypothetical protein